MVIFTNKCKGSFCVESPLYSPFLCEIVKQGGPEAYFDASVPHRYVNAGQETTKMTLLIQYLKKSSIVTGA